jgi:flagellin
MSFSINTNVGSLQAQQYLRTSSDFQQKTINRVTSGLRIVSSGDDAAGLAIANGFRSDQAVLTQGIRNANDGLSQLQIVDGGLNNIAKLLDRARTLATQSATGTFTGSRSVLNSEFTSVVGEIDRQAQAIGLNTGGTFARNLAVFIGGGKAGSGITAIENGSVSVDLSRSTVDAKSLGLKGVQAVGVAGTDLSNASTTSVQNILADPTNANSQAQAGYSDFYFRGPGFSDNEAVKVSVNTSGVTDSSTLTTAINSAIEAAGLGGTAAATSFRNAGIKANIETDPSSGQQRLAFSSSNSAFQVAAGDRSANALLGNFSAGTAGVDILNTATAPSASAAGATVFSAANSNVIVRFQGSGLAQPVDIQLPTIGGTTTVTDVVSALSAAVGNNAALQAAGIRVSPSGFAAGGALSFVSNRGEKFDVSVAGDTSNRLGFGTFQLSTPTATSFNATSRTNSGTTTAGAQTLQFSVGGGASFDITATATAVAATSADALNAAFAADANARAAGLFASVAAGAVTVQSSNGTAFRLNALGANDRFGFGASGVTGAGSTASSLGSTASSFEAGGASASPTFAFSGIRLGDDDQTITVNANDASGASRSVAITLQNDGTSRNAGDIDSAINTINTRLQQSNDSTLQQIIAVKVNDAGTEKIRFLSTVDDFSVSIGANATGATGITTNQGTVVNSTQLAGGNVTDISTQENAQQAVTALSEAVTLLGEAQAVVGRGQNQFTFAVNLAQSQVTNLAASESRIRDADLAAEAANLTKASITLQAGVAALAQANSAPQTILSLLQG